VDFEWDPRKAANNLAKHGVDFAAATRIFEDPYLWSVQDSRIVIEARYQAVGVVDDIILFVVHTLRGDVCRIISARRANRRERATYTIQAGSRS
jgi:uncharacterized DUF497 family protein